MDNLTVIIPFFNGHDTIGQLLGSIPKNLPVIIVDDHSEKKPEIDIGDRNIKVFRPKEKGYFTGAVNYGISQCQTDVVILNQDVWFSDERWLETISTLKTKYATIGENIAGKHPAWPMGYIHGTFMFIRRDAWEEVGPMNADYYPLWGSTCEWQLRATRKGYRAFPMQEIQGMTHERTKNKKPFGSSITGLLKDKPKLKDWLIRTPPAISVVINCYNHGRYLEDAINSLIGGSTSIGKFQGQTFQSFEIIIVNDGSTDNTKEICNALADPWKGIRCIHQNNMGSASACNTGIKAAYGKYIAMLDADDMMLAHRLEDMYLALEENPHSVIFDDILTFGLAGIHKNVKGNPKVWEMPTYNFKQIINKNTMHKGLMFPKIAWEEVGGYPEIMNKGREDWAFNVGLGRLGWCGVKIPKPGYLYRRQGQNRTLKNTTPKWRSKFRSQLELLYPDVYSGRYPMGCCGGGGNRNNANHKGSSKVGGNLMTLPGQSGTVQLEYIGANAGDSSYWGPVTGTRYIFGGLRTVGYVDAADAPGMINMYKHGRQLFQQRIEKVAKPVEYIPKEKTPQYPESTTVIEEHLDDVDNEEEKEFFDPSQFTVSELKKRIPGWGYEQVEYALLTEKNGQQRVTAINALEEALSLSGNF